MANDSHACDFCGLPVPAPLWSPGALRDAGPKYCCFGCRFAHAVTQESGESGTARWTLTRLGIAIFFTMNAMVFTVALWAYGDGVPGEPTQTANAFVELFRFICLLASLPVLFLLGVPLAENALRELRQGRLSTDLLLMVGVIAAFTYSMISVWRGSGEIYFEVGCMVLVFVTLGRWLEATGKLKSTESLDRLSRLLPAEVRLLETSGIERAVPLNSVQIGDRLRVLPGERVPTDGRLCSSRSTMDEQLITGESWPVEKVRGDALIGGTLNLEGDVELAVTAVPSEGTLARLVAVVREARERKGKYQRLADRIVGWFFPVVIALASLTFVLHGLQSGLGSGMLAALSVILIACPCALGIATPMAVWAAIGSAARRGIVLQNGETLERLAGVQSICFDKTGTLTTGQPHVGRLDVADESERFEVARRSASLANSSHHPFSRAIALEYRDVHQSAKWDNIVNVPGQGLRGMLAGESEPTLLGNLRLCDDAELTLPKELAMPLEAAMQTGMPVALIGWNKQVRGVFVFEEELRPHARDTVDQLTSNALRVEVLTGDHAQRGRRLADELGVHVHAELSPLAKQRAVAALRDSNGSVAMIGDGINDASAIATADVGVALGCGADVTRESADVCIISNDLHQLPWLLHLAQRTLRTVRGNLAWAFGYNSIGIVLAMGGWLHPSIAAALMVGSSLIVISRSLRLASDEVASQPTRLDDAPSPSSKPLPQEAAT